MYESLEKELAVTVEKARMNGYWFCNKYFGEWLTPEEFEVLAKVSRIANGQNDRSTFDNYQMRDPRNEIKSRMAQATKLAADLQTFSERVFAYFNQVPKDRK
jgi:hypothetical protein